MKVGLSILSLLPLALLTSINAPTSAENPWEKFKCDERASKIANSTVKDDSSYDVVIFGGTPSGVAAANTAASQGKSVLLLSDGTLFGGAISNGLSATDIGSVEANVGLAKDFLDQVQEYYHTDDYRTEPKVAECIFQGWLYKENITTGVNTTIDSVSVANEKITALNIRTNSTSDDIQISGKTYIDASYAGDLMFEAGVKTRLGMSDYYDYQESVTDYRKFNLQFKLTGKTEIAKAEQDFKKLPQVTISSSLKDYQSLIKTGMPSFTYRLCLTRNPMNSIPFAKTSDYETYAPAWRIWVKNYYGYKVRNSAEVKPNGTVLTQIWRMSKLPNSKYDLNASSSNFTNFPMPKEYFEHPRNRPALLAKYSSYLKSFLWFVQNDPSVPAFEANSLRGFGLCADEFTSTSGWPEHPYLREGRRLVGVTTFTTNDIYFDRVKADGIAIGNYPLDSKSSVFVYAKGEYARDRGEMFRAPLYEIPLSAMIPKRGPTNLIVSVGISASPAAYASVRMEPQFIQLGQAAGFAASLAVDSDSNFSTALSGPVRLALSEAGGFAGIKQVCQEMNVELRRYWGFTEYTCVARKFDLIVAD